MTTDSPASSRTNNKIKSRILRHWGLLRESESHPIENIPTSETDNELSPLEGTINSPSVESAGGQPHRLIRECPEKTEAAARTAPVVSVAAGFGTGLIAGVAAGLLFRR